MYINKKYIYIYIYIIFFFECLLENWSEKLAHKTFGHPSKFLTLGGSPDAAICEHAEAGVHFLPGCIEVWRFCSLGTQPHEGVSTFG